MKKPVDPDARRKARNDIAREFDRRVRRERPSDPADDKPTPSKAEPPKRRS